MILEVLLVFLAAIIFWLLWAPLRIEIDSERGLFRAEWKYICAVQWMPETALDRLEIKVLFYRSHIPLGSGARNKRPAEKAARPKAKAARRSRFSWRTMWRLGRNLMRSFEIKRFRLLWDSDDFIWNAQVYPLAQLASAWGKADIRINFMGQRELALLVENRLGRMLWAVLHTFTTKR